MISTKFQYFTGILLILSQSVVAGEYVPPPSGPYQSSVIINKGQDQTNSAGQVYKFPSDSLIHADKRGESDYLHGIQNQVHSQNPVSEIKTKSDVAPVIPTPIRNMPLPALAKPAGTGSGVFSGNPWAADTLSNPNTFQGNAYPQQLYPGNWNNQQYSFPQQNPYGYNNQNNFMNNPFNGMPSPWTSMPMQPFFSGR